MCCVYVRLHGVCTSPSIETMYWQLSNNTFSLLYTHTAQFVNKPNCGSKGVTSAVLALTKWTQTQQIGLFEM